mmetsp:Transcript_34013/g.82469  ORF Transcript_34013/g.82469 Transcript_34013/m.82469 type:complete len:1203 (+) Transcript_34013:185-3793(+)
MSSKDDHPIVRSLKLLDPILQFLTKATGQSAIGVDKLHTTLPATKQIPFANVQTLLNYNILQAFPLNLSKEQEKEFEEQWCQGKTGTTRTDFQIGFPSPEGSDKRLTGSTKTAAKRRLAELKKKLKNTSKLLAKKEIEPIIEEEEENEPEVGQSAKKDWSLPTEDDPNHVDEPILEIERDGLNALDQVLGLKTKPSKERDVESFIPTCILPRQISYAGSHPAQSADYVGNMDDIPWTKRLHPTLLTALLGKRRLYRHQEIAIRSALQCTPTLVCTGTGSGKSICFLVPVLQAAIEGHRSMLLFPTKALAQDQIVKLQAWLVEHNLDDKINVATLDGDTPHSQRADVADFAHIILTNPDTLHASILPQWKHLYKPVFESLKYVVIDEAHMYEGVFGAHVAMILARLYRVACLNSENKDAVLVFLACSATLAHPEHHFRLLCCIPQTKKVSIVTQDGSPRAAKHFWVWNPPLLDTNGKNMGMVKLPRNRKKKPKKPPETTNHPDVGGPVDLSQTLEDRQTAQIPRKQFIRRRHSADETALLLARAVTRGIRTIAFCKTRGLVEWVYERTLAALKKSPETAKFISKVESYRGGYTKLDRRQIEQKLFQNDLLGVVGTSALELGVDIGGVDLTLHCGFPSSHASLLQQAGRAGRGVAASSKPSLAICVCFNSPVDQHLWRQPSSLLTRGLTAPLSMPIYPGLVQGHLLCAGQEFPLTGHANVLTIQSTEDPEKLKEKNLLCDYDLFGSEDIYQEALETLQVQGAVKKEIVGVRTKEGSAVIYKTHTSIKNPWMKVSIRSMESVNYDIVDTSHPMQGGRMDQICNEAAVMDTIPYSRVFYHAFPGAIIMHRGRRYKIVSMTRPPAFGGAIGQGFRGTVKLGAFAKPSTHRYFTRPLSNLKLTVVKQIERVDNICNQSDPSQKKSPVEDASTIYSDDPTSTSFAGCGVVNLKRNVHGYKKLSLVTREELSRSELSLPDMEFDSFGFWIDCDADVLRPIFSGDKFAYGIHALSHAILAVAPLFVPCVMSDVQCDHSIYHPTRLSIFDARPGGSGICAQLWKSVFIENGLIEAAINLMESCSSCSNDHGYSGGCPACLQAGECIKFNDFLCKTSGIIVGKHLLKRLKQTDVYLHNMKKKAEADADADTETPQKLARTSGSPDIASPRRKARERAMRSAKDISGASQRQTVIGRPSWPMDRSEGSSRQENE